MRRKGSSGPPSPSGRGTVPPGGVLLRWGWILVLATAVGSAGWAPTAGAEGALRVLASDATGVTLRFELPAYRVVPIDRPEGRFARLESSGLTASTDVEGRPVLPTEAALLAYPANTVPRVTVLEEARKTVE